MASAVHKNLKVGVFLNSLPSFGGVYQYSWTMIGALCRDARPDRTIVVFSTIRIPEIERLVLNSGARFVFLGPARLAMELLHRPTFHSVRIALRFALHKLLGRPSDPDIHRLFLDLTGRVVRERHKMDLMIYPRVDFETFENKVPFIFSVHDLQHRINPQFPEVSAGDLWEWREYFFRNGCANALAVFVDSPIGRDDVVNYYGTNQEKIRILPFLPPDYLDGAAGDGLLEEARRTLGLPAKYLFYPAQFWAHKNHKLIVRALGLLRREKGLMLHVVFCGSKPTHHSIYDEVMDLARAEGVAEQVHSLGYVENRYFPALYRLADALVMPTYFGPTNIPILEAWKAGCPVITSDIRGCRDQAGDAALLVGTEDVAGMAAAMKTAVTDEKRRKRLIEEGRKRLKKWDTDKFIAAVRTAVDEACAKLDSARPEFWKLASFEEVRQSKPAIDYPQPAPATTFHDPGREYPFISVITPSFNSSKYIEEAIQSVLVQNYANFEHIVVDGGSTDGTVEILKKYPHIRWLSKKDRGQSDAMNKGFLISRGDVITYLNSDDFYAPGAFFDAVSHLDRAAGKHVVAGMCHVVKPDRSVYVPATVPKVDFFHMMWWWNAWFPINPSAYFYHREVQEKVGGYDSSDHYLMDYDFLLKIALNFEFGVVERVWGNFRWFETNKSAVRPAEHTRFVVAKKYLRHLTLAQRAGYTKNYLAHRAAEKAKS